MKICLITPKINCDICEFSSISKVILKKHVDAEHGDDMQNDPTFKSHCSIQNQGSETPMTRMSKESIDKMKAMKQANEKCTVKLVKCKILGFIYN